MNNFDKKVCVVFAGNVKRFRLKNSLSVTGLAKKAGISRQHIREIELAKKRVTLPTLIKISTALGASPNELIEK